MSALYGYFFLRGFAAMMTATTNRAINPNSIKMAIIATHRPLGEGWEENQEKMS
jgi:hypothetical protein